MNVGNDRATFSPSPSPNGLGGSRTLSEPTNHDRDLVSTVSIVRYIYRSSLAVYDVSPRCQSKRVAINEPPQRCIQMPLAQEFRG